MTGREMLLRVLKARVRILRLHLRVNPRLVGVMGDRNQRQVANLPPGLLDPITDVDLF
jgi:hypothetical protein